MYARLGLLARSSTACSSPGSTTHCPIPPHPPSLPTPAVGNTVPSCAGATIELQVELTEVTGLGHGYYPGVMLEFDPPVVELNDNVGTLYAIFGCQQVPFTLPVSLPDDLAPGTALTVIAKAGEPLCRDGDCRVNDVVSLTRRVQAPEARR